MDYQFNLFIKCVIQKRLTRTPATPTYKPMIKAVRKMPTHLIRKPMKIQRIWQRLRPTTNFVFPAILDDFGLKFENH